MATSAEPAVLDRVRELCTALPEVEERLSHGEPAWFIRDAYVLVAPKSLAALVA